MEAVQNIARLGSGTGEGRRTNRPCKILHDLQAERERVAKQSPVQNIARESRLALSHRRIILPFSLSGFLSYLFLRVGFYPTLSYLILLYPTLSYFFAHAMISLGGKLLKCLLNTKALLRGELSAQQTEGFQMPPLKGSKIKRHNPVRSHHST